jgi:hypothetical protein
MLLVEASRRRFSCCFLPSRGSLPTTQRDRQVATSRHRSSEGSPVATMPPCPWTMADGVMAPASAQALRATHLRSMPAGPSTRTADRNFRSAVCYSASIYHFFAPTQSLLVKYYFISKYILLCFGRK